MSAAESYDRGQASLSSKPSIAKAAAPVDAVQQALLSLDTIDEGQARPSLSALLTLSAPTTPLPEVIRRVVNISQKHVMRGHAEEVSILQFSPDSLHLASGSEDKTVRIWGPEHGALENIFSGHQGKIHGLGYIGSGTILFSASKDKSVIAWDLIKIGQQRLTLNGHTSVCWGVITNHDGTRAITVSHDETWKVWDTMSGAMLKSVKGHTSTVYTLSLSNDGKRLATGSADKLIKIWDLDTGACLKTLVGHSSHVTEVKWVPGSNNLLASCSWDETVKLWNAETGDSIHTFVGHNAKVNCLTVSPDGDCIISGGEDKNLKVWKISTLECFKTLSGHREEILSVAISNDSKYIASGSVDKTIIIWTTTLV